MNPVSLLCSSKREDVWRHVLVLDANESHDRGRLSRFFHEGEIMLVVLIVYLPGSIDLLDRARVAS